MEIQISKTLKVSKGEILLSYGDIASYAFKVESGCLRSYVIDKTGKEHILQFAPKDWLVGDIDSSTNNKPSLIFIDAIEDSEVSCISTAAFGDFASLEKDTLVHMSTKIRNKLIATNNRIISLLSASAKERYIEFTKTYPTLVQRLPLKLIASYIGITPEYLSELRRQLSKNIN